MKYFVLCLFLNLHVVTCNARTSWQWWTGLPEDLSCPIDVSSYHWEEIADSIAAIQRNLVLPYDGLGYMGRNIDIYSFLRKTKHVKTYLDAISHEGDTLLIMEYFPHMKSGTYAAIWNKCKKGTFKHYTYSTFNMLPPNKPFIPHELRDLCESWDIDKLHKSACSDEALKYKYIMATRLILLPNNSYKINCDFFKWDMWNMGAEEESLDMSELYCDIPK